MLIIPKIAKWVGRFYPVNSAVYSAVGINRAQRHITSGYSLPHTITSLQDQAAVLRNPDNPSRQWGLYIIHRGTGDVNLSAAECQPVVQRINEIRLAHPPPPCEHIPQDRRQQYGALHWSAKRFFHTYSRKTNRVCRGD